MSAATLIRWLAATLLALLLGSAHLLDADPEALQLVADEAATAATDVRRLARQEAVRTATELRQP